MMTFAAELSARFGARARAHVPLAPFTTFRVGGPADWLVDARGADEIVAALKLAYRAHVPVTMLGGGSNLLVSDQGVRGLVIRPRGGAVQKVDPDHVRADAAVTINGLVRWTITHGCAGLEAWAGTPGTVGGGIFGNAHFGGRQIGELVNWVRVAAPDGTTGDLAQAEMEFAYDGSRLRRSGEVLLSAVFRVGVGDPTTLRMKARKSLRYRKRTQPLDRPSAGCVFQNPVPERDAVPDGIPWSAGALVDRVGLKGTGVGGACVSHTHGNFIVNEGAATARDIRELIARCRHAVRDRYGVELCEEIVYAGDWRLVTDDCSCLPYS